VYAKALCFLLKAVGGSEKSRLDIGGGSEKTRFATAGTRNDVPLPSHTLSLRLVSLAHNQIINKMRYSSVRALCGLPLPTRLSTVLDSIPIDLDLSRAVGTGSISCILCCCEAYCF